MSTPTNDPLDHSLDFLLSPTPLGPAHTPIPPSSPPKAAPPPSPVTPSTPLTPHTISQQTGPSDIPLTRDPLQIILAGLEPSDRTPLDALGVEWSQANIAQWQQELRSDRTKAQHIKGCIDYLCAHLSSKPNTEPIVSILRELSNLAQNLTTVSVPNMVSIKVDLSRIISSTNRILKQLNETDRAGLLERCGSICTHLATHGQIDKALVWLSIFDTTDQNRLINSIFKKIIEMDNPTILDEFISKQSNRLSIDKKELILNFLNDIHSSSSTTDYITYFEKISQMLPQTEKDLLAFKLALKHIVNTELSNSFLNKLSPSNKTNEMISVYYRINSIVLRVTDYMDYDDREDLLAFINSINDEDIKNEVIHFFINRIASYLPSPIASKNDFLLGTLRQLSALSTSTTIQTATSKLIDNLY